VFSLRKATKDDERGIKDLILASRINPTGLDWRRFTVAVDEAGELIGCGQLKPHLDGSCELSSISVSEAWRGRGVARAIIERFLAGQDPPIWLTCRSSLIPLYERFGFRPAAEEEQPRYFRRLRRLAGVLKMFSGSDDYLAVMVWEGA
jgi:amino-acid N-acetyltransferase